MNVIFGFDIWKKIEAKNMINEDLSIILKTKTNDGMSFLLVSPL